MFARVLCVRLFDNSARNWYLLVFNNLINVYLISESEATKVAYIFRGGGFVDRVAFKYHYK